MTSPALILLNLIKMNRGQTITVSSKDINKGKEYLALTYIKEGEGLSCMCDHYFIATTTYIDVDGAPIFTNRRCTQSRALDLINQYSY